MSSEVDLYVFPNPALDYVSIRYALSDPPSTPLVLFDTLGRRVRQVHSIETGVGIHDLQIDASNLAPSVYYVGLETDSEAITKQ
ncbi:MAG: T9SS type A sorting domain-containing protein [Bacteroidetes bacterium]|nr:T9SS type A sorting domain-containing protein [Bacteroidota bacterium]